MGEVIGELRRVFIGQIAIGGDQGAGDLFQRGIFRQMAGNHVQELLVDRLEHQAGQRVLGLEMAIHGAVGDRAGLGDLLDRDPVHAVAGKELQRGAFDARLGGAGPGRHADIRVGAVKQALSKHPGHIPSLQDRK